MLAVNITVNVDIFTHINVHEFSKIDNFAWIYIPFLNSIASEWHNKSYVHVVHFFVHNNFRKRE